MSEPTAIDLLKDILAKLDGFEKRIGALEKIAHPQHVMADPELTEAIKKLAEKFAPGTSIPVTQPWPYPFPYSVPTEPWSPFRHVSIC